ncbi:helix-turn-helix domain-containing protein [Ralstonia pseudosolanacearum]|uniref:helix-turn-helix domain-containing protein n=1 Tax=Ralstonia pseudosolanacearum TaxID=1310165 RepID=UPI002675DC4C|nr:helix-turn-helix domain-containing protein [Ralstonia pseudosolanacearum]MDO3622831.1 helix-turn-helix domain-containing protein [Ralstonia pseudosolanacearum]
MNSRNRGELPEAKAARPDPLLTIAEAAERLGVSRPVASLLCDAGKLGAVVVAADGRRRVRASTVDAYLVARNRETDGAPLPRAAGVEAGLYDHPKLRS